MLSGATGSFHRETNVQMIGLDVAPVEQAAQQRILGSRHRMKRAGAVERIAKDPRLVSARVPSAIADFNALIGASRRDDACCDNLEPALAYGAGNCGSDFGRDAMAMDIPIRPRMPEEAAMLVPIEALPERMAVRAKAIYRRSPADLGAAAPDPADQATDAARGNIAELDRRGFDIRMRAREKSVTRQR